MKDKTPTFRGQCTGAEPQAGPSHTDGVPLAEESVSSPSTERQPSQLPTRDRLDTSLRWTLAVDQGIGCLGLYTLLPVLGVLLASRTTTSGATYVGLGLFCYSASAGLSAMILNRWLSRLTYLRGMAGSMLLTAVAFGALAYVSSGPAMCALLAVAGLGVSSHYLVSRVLIAEELQTNLSRNRMYSMLQVAVNVAAAAGPFIGGFLIFIDARLLMAAVAACYVLAGAAVLLGVPAALRPAPVTSTWPISGATVRRSCTDPAFRRLLLIGATGAFVYGHFYSAIALFVAQDFAHTTLQGALIAGPALLIAVSQGAVTKVVARVLQQGWTPFAVLLAGALTFSVALFALGLGLPLLTGTIVGLSIFAVAEMVFAPMQSTAFAALDTASAFESFNLRQVCWTLGEALGTLAGGSLFLAAYRGGHQHAYWLVLATVVIVLTGGFAWNSRAATRGPQPLP